MEQNEKRFKTYHRGYENIDELYDDLRDSVLNISLKNGRIIVVYHSDTLEIELAASGGYYTYQNEKKDRGAWDDQDLYPYVLTFVHEQRRDITELEIYDTAITDVSNEGFTYIDDEGRVHSVEYAACARNYTQKNERRLNCVGERNITQGCFVFHTSDVAIKVVFKRLFVLTKKCYFTGRRSERFASLQNHIVDQGYSTYDLS